MALTSAGSSHGLRTMPHRLSEHKANSPTVYDSPHSRNKSTSFNTPPPPTRTPSALMAPIRPTSVRTGHGLQGLAVLPPTLQQEIQQFSISGYAEKFFASQKTWGFMRRKNIDRKSTRLNSSH